jgi:hypothetical protein
MLVVGTQSDRWAAERAINTLNTMRGEARNGNGNLYWDMVDAIEDERFLHVRRQTGN